jgi:hypothetical protein
MYFRRMGDVNEGIFWDVALCGSCVNRLSGRTYLLHLQGRKFRERITSVSRWLQTGDTFLRNIGSHDLHSVTSQKTVFFVVTAVKTSNLTRVWDVH